MSHLKGAGETAITLKISAGKHMPFKIRNHKNSLYVWSDCFSFDWEEQPLN